MEEQLQYEKKCAIKTKTKKRKNLMTSIEKNKIWKILDDETDTTPSIVECVYESNPDICKNCNSTLMVMDEGFPTCVNKNAEPYSKTLLILVPNGVSMAPTTKIQQTQLVAVIQLTPCCKNHRLVAKLCTIANPPMKCGILPNGRNGNQYPIAKNRFIMNLPI